MQTALHYAAPSLLSQYQQHPALNLNRPPNSSSVMPTPPVPTRKRKRAHQYTISYSEVQEVDPAGRLREVIVIDDTPPPSTVSPATPANAHLYSASYQPPLYSAPIRTRARAAAEAQALASSSAAPPPKKRKRDPVDVAGTALKKPTANGHIPHLQNGDSPWAASNSGIPVDDVCDIIFRIVIAFPLC
jgi:dual-specificity kinase